MSWLSRLVNVFRASHLDRDLDEEQRFHLDSRVEDLMRQGLTRAEADTEVARQFGNRLGLREQSRDIKLIPWLESLLQDARFGARRLRQSAAVSAAAVVSLSLAIGGCLAAFALLDALLLRPLPVREPESLVYFTHGSDRDFRFATVFSYPLFERLREVAPAKVDVFATSVQGPQEAVLPDAGGEEETVRAQYVSSNTFGILGVAPAIGRLFTSEDDQRPGDHPVAVLSHAFWKRRFAANPEILGQWIQLDQRPLQIIGVAGRGFTGTEPGVRTDFWVQGAISRRELLTDANNHWLRVWGRLGAGVTREEAEGILQPAVLDFLREENEGTRGKGRFGADPPAPPTLRAQAGAHGLSPLREALRRPLLILAAVVALVLVIACSNVANLLLARAATRERDLALRISIGAGRSRLVQQVLVESGLLAASACVLGLLFARAAAPAIVRMLAPADNSAYLDLRLDGRLVVFVAALGTLTTLLFGLAPAARVFSLAPNAVLAAGVSRQSSRLGLLRLLVAAQVTFSLMVLFVGGLLLVSFQRLMRLDLGFVKSGVALLTTRTSSQREAQSAPLAGQLVLDRIRQVPEVEAASASGWALFSGSVGGVWVQVPGGARVESSFLSVSPGFFATMRIRVLEGREFEPRDLEPDAPPVVVVNELFARRAFPGERALGKTVERDPAREEIVGVVDNAKDTDVRAATPFLYTPLRGVGTLQVRTKGDPLTLAPRLRSEVLRVHPSLRVTSVTRQSTLVDDTLLRERLLALLSGFFGILGLALAAVGLYGVLNYFVVRQTREIGIRIALGARGPAIVRCVLAHTALSIAAGVIAGLAGGLYLARFVAPLLFEVKPLGFWTLALPVAALLAAAALAALPPVRRAVRLDPVAALRHE
jgi:predicted permease